MKPIAITSCLALAAVSLFAAAPQATDTAPQHAETVLSSTRATVAGDSPLVRAAKATNRLNKRPAMVITNETLIHAGGHFTTTTASAQTALPAPPATTAPTMEQMAAEQRNARAESAAKAARTAKLQEQKKAAAARAAARSEEAAESLYTDPPALEGPIPTVKPATPETLGQPQLTTTQKPPN
ncbi:MAG: hypothetical protein WB973_17745 [Thermoanaerobaculia bacterium]